MAHLPLSNKDIINGIKETLTDVIDIKKKDIKSTSSFKEDLGIDSFAAIEILAAIEQKFDIVFDRSKVLKISKFQDIVELTKASLKKVEK